MQKKGLGSISGRPLWEASRSCIPGTGRLQSLFQHTSHTSWPSNLQPHTQAVIIIDVLRRAGANVVVASGGSQLQVRCARGVHLVADALIADVAGSSFDLIAMPVRVGLCRLWCQ